MSTRKEHNVESLNDPLAIARAVGVYQDAPQRRWWKVPRTVEMSTVVIVLGGYAVLTLGVYVGLLIHP
jgi:hypothetical protein